MAPFEAAAGGGVGARAHRRSVRRERRPRPRRRRSRPGPAAYAADLGSGRMSGSDAEARAVWSEVDLDAIRANVRALRELAAPAELLAVVKANGYGHGAVPVARAALECRRDLARRGPRRRGRAAARGRHRRPDHAALGAGAAGRPIGSSRNGSRRSSTPSRGSTRWRRPSPTPDAPSRSPCTSRSTPACTAWAALRRTRWRSPCTSRRVTSSPSPACCTHLAVADEPDEPVHHRAAEPVRRGARRARRRAACARRSCTRPTRRASSTDPRARYDLVRIGIACYGLPPAPELADHAGRHPAARRSRCGRASPW